MSRQWKSRLFVGTMVLSLAVSFGTLGWLLVTTLIHGLPGISWRLFTAPPSTVPEEAGARPAILATVYIAVLLLAMCVPVGVATAIYLEEYAHKERWYNRLLEVNIQNLAAVPAIVYGILGLAVFVELLKPITGPGSVEGKSLLAGGFTIAVMVLPIVIITTQEALRAVPRSIREAGFGVGATRWEVVRSHVLPYAAPGVLTGSVLSMARALGETAPLIMVGAVTGFLATKGGILDALQQRFTSLPTLVFAYVKKPQPEFQDLAAATILVLIVVIFAVNLAAILLRNRYERKW